MTLEEAGKRFHIDMEKLKSYEESGLLRRGTQTDGSFDYTEEDFHQIGLICTLLKAGLDVKITKAYLELSEKDAGSRKSKIQILRKARARLLEGIHEKQQALDEIDYIIDSMKKSWR